MKKIWRSCLVEEKISFYIICVECTKNDSSFLITSIMRGSIAVTDSCAGNELKT